MDALKPVISYAFQDELILVAGDHDAHWVDYHLDLCMRSCMEQLYVMTVRPWVKEIAQIWKEAGRG